MDTAAPRRRGGRPPTYDWDDKRDICHRLYVEEHKSVPQIIAYFAQHFKVSASELPCERSFLRQLQLWGFPNRLRKFGKEEEDMIQARIKELWDQNVMQRDIRAMCAEEFGLENHQFAKMWKNSGLRLRSNQGYGLKRKSTGGQDSTEDAALSSMHFDAEMEAAAAGATGAISVPMAPEDAFMREQRLLEIQLESDAKMRSKKRRRRIRGYGHLPPDGPDVAPRYSSETSLDECKAFLQLDNDQYIQIRKDYEAICVELGIIKKTECADGVWEESKQRLIRENMHLSGVFNPIQPDQDRKRVALDCIAADVTKRMRVRGTKITIAEANNLLGLNPTESKTVRRALYEVLEADKFESRLLCGEGHWQALRQRWFVTNDQLSRAVSEVPQDPKKIKAIDVLCRDVTKRVREDKIKCGEREVVHSNNKYGPGPGPAWAVTAPRSKIRVQEKATGKTVGKPRNGGPRARPSSEHRSNLLSENGVRPTIPAQSAGDISFDIDPALSMAASSAAPAASPVSPAASAHPVAAYFRLDSGCNIVGHHPKMWLGKLSAPTMQELHRAATSKAGAAKVRKVHGIVQNEEGGEDRWLIESTDELEAYLEEAGEKKTFMVVLAGGYA